MNHQLLKLLVTTCEPFIEADFIHNQSNGDTDPGKSLSLWNQHLQISFQAELSPPSVSIQLYSQDLKKLVR